MAFRDPALLREALTHSSFANESPHVSPRDNERMEYLGDAVLQLITAEYLYKLKPSAREGEMTQLRSAMVNTNTLAALAEELGLGDYLFLGKGIAKGGGRGLKSLLANAFESVLGAIFLDAGYDAAYHYYLDRFRSMPEPVKDENYKGRLQQVVQERYGLTPYYDSAGARGGSGRQREYTAVVYAGADPLGTGHGTTKQAAEQEAARTALGELERRAATRKGRPRRRGQAAGEEAPPPMPSTMDVDEEVEPGPLEKAVALAAAAAETAPAAEGAPAGGEPWRRPGGGGQGAPIAQPLPGAFTAPSEPVEPAAAPVAEAPPARAPRPRASRSRRTPRTPAPAAETQPESGAAATPDAGPAESTAPSEGAPPAEAEPGPRRRTRRARPAAEPAAESTPEAPSRTV